MNERIKELHNQCIVRETRGTNAFDSYMVNRFDSDKFAELIVQDCIATVKKRYMGDNNREDMEVRRCVADIQTHFGVEE